MLHDVIIQKTRRPISFEIGPCVVFEKEEGDYGGKCHPQEAPEFGPPSCCRRRNALSNRFDLDGQLLAHIHRNFPQLRTLAAHWLPVEFKPLELFENSL